MTLSAIAAKELTPLELTLHHYPQFKKKTLKKKLKTQQAADVADIFFFLMLSQTDSLECLGFIFCQSTEDCADHIHFVVSCVIASSRLLPLPYPPNSYQIWAPVCLNKAVSKNPSIKSSTFHPSVLRERWSPFPQLLIFHISLRSRYEC